MWWSLLGQTICLQSCVELADLHDEIIVLSRLFVGSCATVGLTEVRCQLGRPVTLTECSFSESMSFPNAVKTDWNPTPYVYPRLPLLHDFFMFLRTVDQKQFLPRALCSSVQRNVGEGHQAGQMVEQSNKEKPAKRPTELKASKQVLFHEQKIKDV